MKKIKCALLLTVMAAGMTGYSQIGNKDEIVKKIFTVMKNKDEDGFLKLFPDAATMKEYMKKLFGSGQSTDEDELAQMKGFLDKITDSSLEKEFRKDFKEYLEKGEENGVNWSHATLVSYTADSTQTDEEGVMMSKLAGKIYFNADQKEFFLKYDEVIWFDGKGWYGVSIRRVDEKANEDKPDEYDYPMMDSSMIMADSVALMDTAVAEPAPPPPPPKPKAPVKKQPVKKQSPAKKPD